MHLAKAVERAVEKEQLQQARGLPGTKHGAREIERQDAPETGGKGIAVERRGEAGVLQGVVEATPTKVRALSIFCIRYAVLEAQMKLL